MYDVNCITEKPQMYSTEIITEKNRFSIQVNDNRICNEEK